MTTNGHSVSGRIASFRQLGVLQIQDMYVVAIQRGVASRAKCLVLFGGGQFQFVALNEYVHNYPEESDQYIHQVFVADRFKTRNKQTEKLKQ